jgi:hypothetical protein
MARACKHNKEVYMSLCVYASKGARQLVRNGSATYLLLPLRTTHRAPYGDSLDGEAQSYDRDVHSLS